MQELNQPILSRLPEYNHDNKDVLTLADFLNLLKEEEDYFQGEQYNTKLMITRLRKIFYDKWGWNTQLIKGAAYISGRYQVKIINEGTKNNIYEGKVKKVKRYLNNEYTPKYRLVTYRKNDRIYKNSRKNEVPFIYQKDHQDVLLPDGYYCDIAHVLAGLDAFNYPQVVSPLPSFLFFLYKLFPHADSNVDITTWLGDIATSAEDFLFAFIRNNRQSSTTDAEQNYININASASDMLGDIDAYVIHKFYNIGAKAGRRVTDILEEYYSDNPIGEKLRKQRFDIFCESVGLKSLVGNKFLNEDDWIAYYKKQLRNTTSFMVYSLTEETVKSIRLPIAVCFKRYEDVIKLEVLLGIFLQELKKLIKTDSTCTTDH